MKSGVRENVVLLGLCQIHYVIHIIIQIPCNIFFSCMQLFKVDFGEILYVISEGLHLQTTASICPDK